MTVVVVTAFVTFADDLNEGLGTDPPTPADDCMLVLEKDTSGSAVGNEDGDGVVAVAAVVVVSVVELVAIPAVVTLVATVVVVVVAAAVVDDVARDKESVMFFPLFSSFQAAAAVSHCCV